MRKWFFRLTLFWLWTAALMSCAAVSVDTAGPADGDESALETAHCAAHDDGS